jgi:hypothetical protein
MTFKLAWDQSSGDETVVCTVELNKSDDSSSRHCGLCSRVWSGDDDPRRRNCEACSVARSEESNGNLGDENA